MGGEYLVWEGKENFRGFRDFRGIDPAVNLLANAAVVSIVTLYF